MRKSLVNRLLRRTDGTSISRTLIPGVCLSLAISFLLMLYGPLELFFTNIREFYFGLWTLLPSLLAGFFALLAVCLLGFLLCYILHVHLYDFALLLAGVGYVCTYVQGMFLAGNLPPLDGRAMDWAGYSGQNVYTLILWAVVIILAALLTWHLGMVRMYKVLSGTALFLTAVLLVTGLTVGIVNQGFSRRPDVAVTKDQEFTMSADKNLVIFVVDAADSKTFHDLLESRDPEFGEILSDFTYYPDTLCAYPFTEHSIPFILEGQWYENRGDFHRFVTEAMDASPLLGCLRQEHYRMGVYEEDLIYDGPGIFDFENVDQVEYYFSSIPGVLKAQMKLVWFKYAPFLLKHLVFPSLDDFNNYLKIRGGQEHFWAANWDFDRDVKAARPEIVQEKCFRFIHVEGAHVPFRYNREVEVIPSSEGSYEMNMEASMTLVDRYLTLLKENGVYDNTAIVILGDHGYGYGRADTTLGRGNAFLAVKGIGERRGSMETSQAPISYEDLQTAYLRLLDGAPGNAVFEAAPGEDRPRRFLLYEYTEEDHMVEYILRGHAFDIANMTPTGRVFDRQD